jgi:hypothetical protein
MIEDRGVEIWEWNQPNLALPVAAPTPSRAVPPAMAARVRSAVASGRRAHPSGFEVVAHPQAAAIARQVACPRGLCCVPSVPSPPVDFFVSGLFHWAEL